MTYKYAKGGIGDLLLCVQSAIEEKTIDLYSHYAYADSIFLPFGVSINRFDYFRNIEELNSIYAPGESLKSLLHPKFVMPHSPFKKPIGKVIGIHIEGSRFSNEFWAKRGKPSKNMSDEFLVKLIQELQFAIPNVIFYIFCDPHRTNDVGQLLASVVYGDYFIISFTKIWGSLSCVPHCSCVIGMDSAIKSMSAILSIPTVTLVGDYEDSFRDSVFLNPYINEGIMAVVKFNDINNVNPRDVVKYIEL
jgi:ADP-heptose:LPS heptosyltransferase